MSSIVRLGISCLIGISGFMGAASAQTVTGKVTDALSHQPIAGAQISVQGHEKTYTVDALGIYITDTLAKGNYTVRAQAPGYLPQGRNVILAARTEVGADRVSADFTLYNITTSIAPGSDNASGPASIKYFFPGHNIVELTIADSTGKTIRQAFDRSRKGGSRKFVWDGKNNDGKILAAGTYSCKLVSGNLVMMRKLIWKGEESKQKLQ